MRSTPAVQQVSHREAMRVAIVTESFLPQVNGVTNTVRHVVERPRTTGHEALVVAPGPGPASTAAPAVVRVRSVRPARLPLVPARAARHRRRAGHRRASVPDVVHLASPIVLGAVGLRAARRLGIPTVAVYQTDVAGFARQYGSAPTPRRAVGRRASTAGPPARWCPRARRTPSSAALGVADLHLWRRGRLARPVRARVAAARTLRAAVDRVASDVVVGYVGRLAAEKQVRRLRRGRRRPRDPAGRGRRRPGARLAGAAPPRSHASPACSAATSSRPRSPPSTSSSTPARPRRSARPCRRRRPAACPWSRRPPAAPSTSWQHGRTGLLYDPRDPALAARARRATWSATPACAAGSPSAALADVCGAHLGPRGRPARRRALPRGFNLRDEGNIRRVVTGEHIGTVIH